jgi:hypothetical protein
LKLVINRILCVKKNIQSCILHKIENKIISINYGVSDILFLEKSWRKVKKIKKSPRYIVGGLERIFVVIDHKMCCIESSNRESTSERFLANVKRGPG